MMNRTLFEIEDDFVKEFPSYGRSSDRLRYELLEKLIGTSVDQGLFILYHLQKACGYPGAVCEFGVAQGATSALMANEIRDLHKKLMLFDSFKGLPKPTKKDILLNDIFKRGDIKLYEGSMSVPQKEVEDRLRQINFPMTMVNIVPGFVEETLLQQGHPDAATICFANIDMDFYEPTCVALDWLHERLIVGGVIVVHDIKFFTAGPESATKEFAVKHRDKYLYRLRGNQLAITRREL